MVFCIVLFDVYDNIAVTFFSQILECQLRSVKHDICKDDLVSVAACAHGYVGADLAAVCREGITNEPCICVNYKRILR